jgi:hypothetical protein
MVRSVKRMLIFYQKCDMKTVPWIIELLAEDYEFYSSGIVEEGSFLIGDLIGP